MEHLKSFLNNILAHPAWTGVGVLVAIISLIFAFYDNNILQKQETIPLQIVDDSSEKPSALNNSIEKQEKISDLIELASIDIKEYRLTTPVGNNAHEKYLKVLELEPDNIIAKNGITKIVNTYVNLTNGAISKFQFDEGKSYLSRAKSIDPDNQAILMLEKDIDQIERKTVEAAIISEKATQSLVDATKADKEQESDQSFLIRDATNAQKQIDALLVAIKNINDDYYALLRVQKGVRTIVGGISGDNLSRIISVANIADDYYCLLAIQSSVGYLNEPLSAGNIESILSSISDDYYRLLAANSLQ